MVSLAWNRQRMIIPGLHANATPNMSLIRHNERHPTLLGILQLCKNYVVTDRAVCLSVYTTINPDKRKFVES